MFGGKGKAKGSITGQPVANMDHPLVKTALQGQWVTLALARFETTFSTVTELKSFDDPKAYGVVHLPFNSDSQIRCELTLLRDPADVDPTKVGAAYIEQMDDREDPHLVFRFYLTDPRGKIEKALQSAFDSAALSTTNFVHFSLRRTDLDVEAILSELKEKDHGGDHPLIGYSLTRKTTLPHAPAWSWRWSMDP